MPASDVLKMLLKVGKNDLSVAERVTAEKLSAEGFEGLQAPMRGLKRDAGVPAKTSDSRWEETKARFEEFAKSRQGAAPETASSGGLRVPTFTRNWLNDRALGPQAFMRTVASDSEAGLVFKATRDAVGRVETNGVMSSVHIGEGLYATAAHGIDTGRTWEQVFQPHKRIFVNGDAAALVAGDKRADAALLYVHKHEKNPFVGVGSTRELEVGQTIHTVGFPAQSPLALVSEDPFRALLCYRAEAETTA